MDNRRLSTASKNGKDPSTGLPESTAKINCKPVSYPGTCSAGSEMKEGPKPQRQCDDPGDPDQHESCCTHRPRRSTDLNSDQQNETSKTTGTAGPSNTGMLPSSAPTEPVLSLEHEDGMLPIPPCMSLEDMMVLQNAIADPPITKDSLRELDLFYVQNNITLRVDINYDHDLHYTPVSGLKGKEKGRKAKAYWQSLAAELEILCQHNLLASCPECEAQSSRGPISQFYFHPRLERMLNALKDLLYVLVPAQDHDQLARYLDIPLLMQQSTHGLLDVGRLGRWLFHLLTMHCAPIRDTMAKEMAERMKEGAETGNFTILADGIEKLFAFLESMKLDVSNFQIRAFRYNLIDLSVSFQQEWFQFRIDAGKLQVDQSCEWFQMATSQHQTCEAFDLLPHSTPLAAIVHGIVSICLSPKSIIPATLEHDSNRLHVMQDEIQDIIHMDICLSLLQKLVYKVIGKADVSSVRSRTPVRSQIDKNNHEFRVRLMDLTEGTASGTMTMSEMWRNNSGNIALEILRAASDICGSILDSAPRSFSNVEVASTTDQLLEAFSFEQQNQTRLKNLSRTLEELAQAQVHEFENMTILAISMAQRKWHQNRLEKKQKRLMPDEEDIARRLAHLAVVHFKVWAEMAYLAPTCTICNTEEHSSAPVT